MVLKLNELNQGKILFCILIQKAKMVKLFKKLFIKNYKNIEDTTVRYSYGVSAGRFGIISNLLMAIGKIIIGIFSGSIAIIGDAINNFSDTASSVTTVIGFKIAAKPADKDHPYGHARFEYVTGLIIATVMIIVGITIGKSAIERIITPTTVSITFTTYIVLIVSVLFKLFQTFLYSNFAKTIKSDALKAAGMDSRNDILSTIAVILSAIIIQSTGINIDAYMGIAVSLFIIVSSIMLLIDSINPLLGQKPDKDLIKKIRAKLLSYETVQGIHDLMIHDYGPNTCFAVVHVEIEAREDILKAHDLIDNIEKDFLNDLRIHLVIHMDPIDTENELVNFHREKCTNLLKKLNPILCLHDFRMVQGHTHTNIIFDVEVPFEIQETRNSLTDYFNKTYKDEKHKFFFVIEIDRPQ